MERLCGIMDGQGKATATKQQNNPPPRSMLQTQTNILPNFPNDVILGQQLRYSTTYEANEQDYTNNM